MFNRVVVPRAACLATASALCLSGASSTARRAARRGGRCGHAYFAAEAVACLRGVTTA